MNLIPVIDDIFHQIKFYLLRLDKEAYQKPLEIYSGSSIGQHTRHIIEFFQCLIDQIDQGKINYDLRQRNKELEQKPLYAIDLLDRLSLLLPQLHSPIILRLASGYIQERDFAVDTSLNRELLYNIEHAVHHLAMIKIGLKEIAPELRLPEHFGVAKSTIQYQQKKQTA